MTREIPWPAVTGSVVAAELSRQHSELLQIVNQRFQLVTLAVTGTIAILGWFGGQAANPNIDPPRVAHLAGYITVCGLAFLALLFFLSQMLYRTIRIFDTLILVRYEEPSGSPLFHEHLWKSFRDRRWPVFNNRKYRAYSTPFGWIYCILAFIVWALPWLARFQLGNSLELDQVDWIGIALLVGVLFFVIISTWTRAMLVSEEDLKQAWREVLKSAEPPNKPLQPTSGAERHADSKRP